MSMAKKRIIVGAGNTKGVNWIATDQNILNLLVERDWASLVKPGSLDAILAEHVWEHLTADQAVIAARHCFKYLKPGGYVRVAVPDGYHPSQRYINDVKPGGSGLGSGDHKILYTYETATSLFTSAGFDVVLYEYFDSTGMFHEYPWDAADGMITRSRWFDKRNVNGLIHYTSIILDAIKKKEAMPNRR